MESDYYINLELIKNEFKTPLYFETWNWEGDESVLIWKLKTCMEKAGLNMKIYSDENLNSFVKSKDFEKTHFIFMTYRGETAGTIYYNKIENKIMFFVINPNFKDREIAESLFSKLVKIIKKYSNVVVYHKESSSVDFDKLMEKFK